MLEDDQRRRRLRFRAWHRGIREMDILLGRFADHRISDLEPAELDQFEALLDVPDQQVYDWISGRTPPPADFDTPLLRELQGLTFSPNDFS